MKLPDAPIIEKVRQWLAYADEDLRVARHGFSMPETPPCRVIAFHAQQCAPDAVASPLRPTVRLVDFWRTPGSRLTQLSADIRADRVSQAATTSAFACCQGMSSGFVYRSGCSPIDEVVCWG
jgi:hypothetical protein